MAYIVDFLIGTMKDLSSTKPVMFQRDGDLYVVSEAGFAKTNFGLATAPIEIKDWEKDKKQPASIEESTDLILRWKEENWNQHPVYRKGEAHHLEHIAFGRDDDTFSLEEITASAKRLGELKDDGKIRMIRHISNYHSHKFGYACDGIDVWVESARKMDRERYLALLRQQEDFLMKRIERVQMSDARYREETYVQGIFPSGLIMTSELMVLLPRSGKLNPHTDSPESWNTHRHLGQYSDGIITTWSPDTRARDPFRIKVKLNAGEASSCSAEELGARLEEKSSALTRQLAALQKHAPEAEEIVSRLNALHCTLFKDQIEEHEKFLRGIEEMKRSREAKQEELPLR
ncbi:hypothetical protein JW711_03865 [Candidatus Woesearchaeota archaeon]|nr:hypothetical protein [Candidatus Woesearchaeota archaeon]